MPRYNRHSLRFIFVMSVIFFIMSYLFWDFSKVVSLTELVSFDSYWIETIQNHISDKMTPIMHLFTFLGSTTWFGITTIIAFLILFFGKQKSEAFLFVSTMAFSGIFNQILKMLYHRPRPTIQPLIEATGYSFPSGHSMASFTFYGLLAFFFILKIRQPIARIGILLLATCTVLMVGVSRIYLGVHYPTDVAAGFTAGAATLVLFFIAYQATRKKKCRT